MSVLHIKTEVECRVFLFDEEKGIAMPNKYFNLQVRKGELELLFKSTINENKQYRLCYLIEDNDCDYTINIFEKFFTIQTEDIVDVKKKYGFRKVDNIELSSDYNNVNDKDLVWIDEDGSMTEQFNRGSQNMGINRDGICVDPEWLYLYKTGCECAEKEDWVIAAKCFLSAAEMGYSEAQYRIGECYKKGNGVTQSYSDAVKWYRKSAEQGNPNAQCSLGYCFYFGTGIRQDYEKAKKWFEQSANQGNAIAQYAIGMGYRRGDWERKSSEEARKWARMSAEQGYAPGQTDLANSYYYGWVEKDYSEAIKWYKKAAVQGDCDAQYHLAKCYRDGTGTTSNHILAARWMQEAAKNGHAEAKNQCEKHYPVPIIDVLMKSAISTKQFSIENGHIVSLRPIAKTASNPKGILFSRHLPNGQTVDVHGIGCVKENGSVIMLALGKSLSNMSISDIGKNFPTFFVYNIDIYGKKHNLYILINDKSDIYEYLTLDDESNESPSGDGFNNTNNQNTPYYLFFDTETTGLPKDDNAPASNIRNWPRLVQLAWILTDKEGNMLSSSCNIIKPDGFTIPDDAAKVHGINTYKAMREGKPLRSVIGDFLKSAEKARCLVGHNVVFDQKVIGAELCRLGIKDTISTVKAICTMEVGKDFCKIPGGYYGYKPPKLQELHQKLFGTTFDNAHDAMADVKATKRCFFELKRLDIPELIFQEGLALLN